MQISLLIGVSIFSIVMPVACFWYICDLCIEIGLSVKRTTQAGPTCCRPPLCVAVQKQHPLNLVNMLLLPCKKYRPKGLEELDKECSALGYAMQAGQPELVEAVSTSQVPASAVAHQGSRLV